MFDVLHTSQPFDASDVVIDTGRLMLRRWRESDAEALYSYASDGRVSEMAMWPRHTSVEMSRRVITEYFIPNSFNFAMVLKATGEPIGYIGLVPEGDENCPASVGEREVGYWIGWPYWGRGLTTEALRALIDWCGRVPEVDTLLLTADLRNVASQCVAQKCGFIHLDDIYRDGGTPIRLFRLGIVASRL
ncbi:N-acetyltransferase [Muribaculaceae bacterium Isolate-105 (HZI)]|nr:N-acetyltransferase [Muribaculaceae bacterium Isolate-105 (HZI)]